MKSMLFFAGIAVGILLDQIVPHIPDLEVDRTVSAGQLIQVLVTILVAYIIGHTLKIHHEKGKDKTNYLIKEAENASRICNQIREKAIHKDGGSYCATTWFPPEFRSLSNSLYRIQTLLESLGESNYETEIKMVKRTAEAMRSYKAALTGGKLTVEKRHESEGQWTIVNERILNLICALLKR